ncbi:hypothetical protein OSTOST_23609, partial [Ostertagia ostertagi]
TGAVHFSSSEKCTSIEYSGYASGCVFGDEGLAITVMSAFMQALLVFGGFYINLHSVPMWMRPFSALSFFKYSFEALQINQWTDITYIKGCTGLLSHGNNTVYCPSETGKVSLALRLARPGRLRDT